jgi:3-oxoacyl-[acyl-carrier protein] reductase
MSRVVVVSGGGTGIGRAVAQRFAASGDDVLIVGRRAEMLSRAVDDIRRDVGDVTTISSVVADLADPGDAERVRTTVAQRHGRVDVLVNNAGGNAEVAAAADPAYGLARVATLWSGNFRTNVLTAVLLTEALTDLLADGGRVVLLSSIAAFRGSGSGSYAGMKAALHPYAIDLAAALGGRRITVNVVAPGFTAETEFFGDTMTEARRSALIGQTLTGRAGTVDDVAETIHWLASAAAGHVTAQIIQVNGGALAGR